MILFFSALTLISISAISFQQANADTTENTYKFDSGFYEKISSMLDSNLDTPQSDTAGSYGQASQMQYYNVILITDDKERLIDKLESVYYAQNIFNPNNLQTVITADIPMHKIHELSLEENILKIGDGEYDLTSISSRYSSSNNSHNSISDAKSFHSLTRDISQTGRGITIGVLDVAFSPSHNDLSDTVLEKVRCYSNSCSTRDFSTVEMDSHFNQVASIMSGTGKSNSDMKGFAPDSKIRFTAITDPRTQIMALDYLVGKDVDLVTIVSGRTTLSCSDYPSIALVIDEVVDRGIPVVIGIGNNGNGSVLAPACSLNGIAVGNVDASGTIHSSSSRGGHATNNFIKPDLAALGTNIAGASSGSSYVVDSGTSFSTPIVSGVVALMLEKNPSLTPQEIKVALMSNADLKGFQTGTAKQYEDNNRKIYGSMNQYGAGILNVANTLDAIIPSNSKLHTDMFGSKTSTTHNYRISADANEFVKVFLNFPLKPLTNDVGNRQGDVSTARLFSSHVPLKSQLPNFDLEIRAPNGDKIKSDSAYQNTEFVIFQATQSGNYAVKVSAKNVFLTDSTSIPYAIGSSKLIQTPPYASTTGPSSSNCQPGQICNLSSGDNPPPNNRAPDANVKDRLFRVSSGDVISLDGSGSSDYEGQTLSFLWSVLRSDNTSVAVDSPTSSRSTISIPYSDSPRTAQIIVRLFVSDGFLTDYQNVVLIANLTPAPDTTAPVILQPRDITMEATSLQTPVVITAPSVSDSVDPSPTLTSNATSTFPLGSTMIIWTATDASGNKSTTTQTVTITDTTPPIIIAPKDIILDAPQLDISSAVVGNASTTDLVDPNPSLTFSDMDDRDANGIGMITRTWMSTDMSGNTATAIQTITVEDATGPIISVNYIPGMLSSDSLILSGTISDPESSITKSQIKLNDGSWQNIDSSFSKTFTNLPEGTHTITIKSENSNKLTAQKTVAFKVQIPNIHPEIGLTLDLPSTLNYDVPLNFTAPLDAELDIMVTSSVERLYPDGYVYSDTSIYSSDILVRDGSITLPDLFAIIPSGQYEVLLSASYLGKTYSVSDSVVFNSSIYVNELVSNNDPKIDVIQIHYDMNYDSVVKMSLHDVTTAHIFLTDRYGNPSIYVPVLERGDAQITMGELASSLRTGNYTALIEVSYNDGSSFRKNQPVSYTNNGPDSSTLPASIKPLPVYPALTNSTELYVDNYSHINRQSHISFNVPPNTEDVQIKFVKKLGSPATNFTLNPDYDIGYNKIAATELLSDNFIPGIYDIVYRTLYSNDWIEDSAKTVGVSYNGTYLKPLSVNPAKYHYAIGDQIEVLAKPGLECALPDNVSVTGTNTIQFDGALPPLSSLRCHDPESAAIYHFSYFTVSDSPPSNDHPAVSFEYEKIVGNHDQITTKITGTNDLNGVNRQVDILKHTANSTVSYTTEMTGKPIRITDGDSGTDSFVFNMLGPYHNYDFTSDTKYTIKNKILGNITSFDVWYTERPVFFIIENDILYYYFDNDMSDATITVVNGMQVTDVAASHLTAGTHSVPLSSLGLTSAEYEISISGNDLDGNYASYQFP